MTWTKVVVQRSTFRGFPQHCASCLTMDNLEVFTARTSGWLQKAASYRVPICANCARRDRWLSRIGWLLLVLSPLAGDWIAFHFNLTGWIRFAARTLITLPFIYLVGHRKVPVKVFKKSGQGTITFWLRDEQYAQEFAALHSAMYEPVLFAPVL